MIDEEYDDGSPIMEIDRWQSYLDNVHGADLYVDGTMHMTRKIDEILQNSKSFSEMKEELEKFRDNRKAFLIFALSTI